MAEGAGVLPQIESRQLTREAPVVTSAVQPISAEASSSRVNTGQEQRPTRSGKELIENMAARFRAGKERVAQGIQSAGERVFRDRYNYDPVLMQEAQQTVEEVASLRAENTYDSKQAAGARLAAYTGAAASGSEIQTSQVSDHERQKLDREISTAAYIAEAKARRGGASSEEAKLAAIQATNEMLAQNPGVRSLESNYVDAAQLTNKAQSDIRQLYLTKAQGDEAALDLKQGQIAQAAKEAGVSVAALEQQVKEDLGIQPRVEAVAPELASPFVSVVPEDTNVRVSGEEAGGQTATSNFALTEQLPTMPAETGQQGLNIPLDGASALVELQKIDPELEITLESTPRDILEKLKEKGFEANAGEEAALRYIEGAIETKTGQITMERLEELTGYRISEYSTVDNIMEDTIKPALQEGLIQLDATEDIVRNQITAAIKEAARQRETGEDKLIATEQALHKFTDELSSLAGRAARTVVENKDLFISVAAGAAAREAMRRTGWDLQGIDAIVKMAGLQGTSLLYTQAEKIAERLSITEDKRSNFKEKAIRWATRIGYGLVGFNAAGSVDAVMSNSAFHGMPAAEAPAPALVASEAPVVPVASASVEVPSPIPTVRAPLEEGFKFVDPFPKPGPDTATYIPMQNTAIPDPNAVTIQQYIPQHESVTPGPVEPTVFIPQHETATPTPTSVDAITTAANVINATLGETTTDTIRGAVESVKEFVSPEVAPPAPLPENTDPYVRDLMERGIATYDGKAWHVTPTGIDTLGGQPGFDILNKETWPQNVNELFDKINNGIIDPAKDQIEMLSILSQDKPEASETPLATPVQENVEAVQSFPQEFQQFIEMIMSELQQGKSVEEVISNAEKQANDTLGLQNVDTTQFENRLTEIIEQLKRGELQPTEYEKLWQELQGATPEQAQSDGFVPVELNDTPAVTSTEQPSLDTIATPAEVPAPELTAVEGEYSGVGTFKGKVGEDLMIDKHDNNGYVKWNIFETGRDNLQKLFPDVSIDEGQYKFVLQQALQSIQGNTFTMDSDLGKIFNFSDQKGMGQGGAFDQLTATPDDLIKLKEILVANKILK